MSLSFLPIRRQRRFEVGPLRSVRGDTEAAASVPTDPRSRSSADHFLPETGGGLKIALKRSEVVNGSRVSLTGACLVRGAAREYVIGRRTPESIAPKKWIHSLYNSLSSELKSCKRPRAISTRSSSMRRLNDRCGNEKISGGNRQGEQETCRQTVDDLRLAHCISTTSIGFVVREVRRLFARC